jgi:hypothetical protein
MAEKLMSLAAIADMYQGRYDELLAALCGNLVDDALKANGRHVTDPNGETRKGAKTFRLDKNFAYNGKWYYNSPSTNHGVFNCIEYVTGWSMSTIHAEANKYVRNSGHAVAQANQEEVARRKAEQAHRQQMEWTENAHRIHKVRKGSCPIKSLKAFPVLAYLGKRGIDLPLEAIPSCIGFHPELPYWDANLVNHGNHPCMLNKVTDVHGNLITLHRTYLDKDGNKFSTESDEGTDDAVKKLMSPCGNSFGSSIKFHSPKDGVLAVAEGVETALSVFVATGHPVWATVSAGMMGNLEVPPNVRILLIYADKDKSNAGQIAAEKLKTRLEERGIKVLIFYPPTELAEGQKSVDWNDELIANGPRSFVPTMAEYVRAHESLKA